MVFNFFITTRPFFDSNWSGAPLPSWNDCKVSFRSISCLEFLVKEFLSRIRFVSGFSLLALLGLALVYMILKIFLKDKVSEKTFRILKKVLLILAVMLIISTILQTL